MIDSLVKRSLTLLEKWADFSKKYWNDVSLPGLPPMGHYGTGYSCWGTQTQLKYCAAMGVLGVIGKSHGYSDWEWAIERSLEALRFSLHSHIRGQGCCTDGRQWGDDWLSGLGIERMMHAVYLLEPYLSDKEKHDIREMLTAQSQWISNSFHRGEKAGIQAGLWGDDGDNMPESNIWNGAILWRTAEMYPQSPGADDWREMAHCFFINGLSIARDADDQTVLAGKTISQRYVGPNFFPNFALNHHGYTNVGYMAICTSNAAMLHFDMKRAGLDRPETLDHHQRDMWKVLRRFIFSDATLVRIGGDTRVRYCYCQDYLLPSLLYAADHLGDPHAFGLIDRLLSFYECEGAHNADGSFFSNRLKPLAEHNEYYYTRLESDRACVLGQLCANAEFVESPSADEPDNTRESFERSVAGGWCEPGYGAAAHRSKTRFASFAWRANKLAQGLCLPGDDGHLAAWRYNLAGYVIPVHGSHGVWSTGDIPPRRLKASNVTEFDGGFAVCGAIVEGTEYLIPEGWSGQDAIIHAIAFVALPDNHTVVCLQHAWAGEIRTYVQEVAPLHLNIPNDLYNSFSRRIFSASGEREITWPADGEDLIALNSNWANVDNRLGVVGLYGADTLTLDRGTSSCRTGIEFQNIDRICWGYKRDCFAAMPGENIMDVAWSAVSGVDAEQTEKFAANNQSAGIEKLKHDSIRAVRVTAMDERKYMILANFSDNPADIPPQANCEDSQKTTTILGPKKNKTIAPWSVQLLCTT